MAYQGIPILGIRVDTSEFQRIGSHFSECGHPRSMYRRCSASRSRRRKLIFESLDARRMLASIGSVAVAASEAADRIAIVWTDDDDQGQRVVMQLTNGQGDLVAAPFVLSETGADYIELAVDMDHQGTSTIAFADAGGVVETRQISADGIIRNSCSLAANGRFLDSLSVAAGFGRAVIAWETPELDEEGGTDAVFTTITEAGSCVEVYRTPENSDEARPHVAATRDGFLFTWDSWVENVDVENEDTGAWATFVATFSSTGVGSSWRPFPDQTTPYGSPTIWSDDAGAFLVDGSGGKRWFAGNGIHSGEQIHADGTIQAVAGSGRFLTTDVSGGKVYDRSGELQGSVPVSDAYGFHEERLIAVSSTASNPQVTVYDENLDTELAFFTLDTHPIPLPKVTVVDSASLDVDRVIPFGRVKPDETIRHTVTFTNADSESSVRLTGWQVPVPFSLDVGDNPLRASDEVTLSPGESTSVSVIFSPTQKGSYQGQMTLVANAVQISLVLSGVTFSPDFLGANYASWNKHDGEKEVSTEAIKDLADNGADTVAIVTTFYVGTPESNEIEVNEKTVSPRAFEKICRDAHDAGLRLVWKPHIDVYNSVTPRDKIQPEDRQEWFRSYRETIFGSDDQEGYYTTALKNLADDGITLGLLVIGTELQQLSTYDSEWSQVISAVRNHLGYGGPITYAFNVNDQVTHEYEHLTQEDAPPTLEGEEAFWKELSYIGLDFYPDLAAAGTNPSTVELLDVLRAKLDVFKNRYDELGFDVPVLITEMGFVNAARAYETSNNPPRDSPIDEVMQSQCLEAMYLALAEREWVAGSFVWRWHNDENPIDREEDGVSYSPRGKEAENVAAYWWSRFGVEHRWHNPLQPYDVNNNGEVTALDTLIVINALGRNDLGAHTLSVAIDGPSPHYLDVSKDDKVSALDALLVLNYLLRTTEAKENEAVPAGGLAVDSVLHGFELAPDPPTLDDGLLDELAEVHLDSCLTACASKPHGTVQ